MYCSCAGQTISKSASPRSLRHVSQGACSIHECVILRNRGNSYDITPCDPSSPGIHFRHGRVPVQGLVLGTGTWDWNGTKNPWKGGTAAAAHPQPEPWHTLQPCLNSAPGYWPEHSLQPRGRHTVNALHNALLLQCLISQLDVRESTILLPHLAWVSIIHMLAPMLIWLAYTLIHMRPRVSSTASPHAQQPVCCLRT